MFTTHVFEYLKLVSYCVVPFVVVIALNVGILVRINRVYSNVAMRRECGHREAAAAAVYRHQPPMVVLGPPSTPSTGANLDNGLAGARPQWQHRELSPAHSESSATRQSSLNVQKLRQRRLTRMLLFISFAWLALTAPFTLHSFFPEPSPPSSTSSSSTFYESPPSVTTATFDHLLHFPKVDQSRVGKSLNQDNREIQYRRKRRRHVEKKVLCLGSHSLCGALSQRGLLYPIKPVFDQSEIQYSTLTSSLNSNELQTTTKQSFLAEDHAIFTSSASVSTSLPSTSVDPSRNLLVKTIARSPVLLAPPGEYC